MKRESQPANDAGIVEEKISPMTGILDKTGIDVFPKATLILSVCPLVIHRFNKKDCQGGAIKFNTVPETIWSARK